METVKVSRTSEGTTAIRAREMRKPPEERICNDSFAPLFLSPYFQVFRKYPVLGRVYGWLSEHRCPGLRGGVLARTRFMDEQTTACLHSGIDQLVILGAGFDSRAYRLMTPEAGVTVFELDHPATQSVKKAKLKEVLQQLPAHVVFVPIDFNRDDLTTTLNKSGYNPNGKTLFIWEGVIYYLTAAAVVNTLSFITQHSGSGSSIIFDYFPQAVIDGTDGSRGAQKMCSRVKAWGEPFLFGIRDEELEPFLRERGFREIKTVAASSCKEAWFHGTNKDIVVSELFRFVHATHFCSKGGKHENE